jgi:hypothetical protein
MNTVSQYHSIPASTDIQCPMWRRAKAENRLVQNYREIEQEAVVRQTYLNSAFIPVSFNSFDEARFRALLKERANIGKETLQDFEAWLRRSERLEVRTARDIRSTIWAALCDTNGSPEIALADDNRTGRYRRRLFFALERFTRFLVDQLPSNDEDVIWAGRLRTWCALHQARYRHRSLERDRCRRGMSAAEYGRVLSALVQHRENLHRKRPWAWPALYMLAVGGLTIAQVVRLDREELESAFFGQGVDDDSFCFRFHCGERVAPLFLIAEVPVAIEIIVSINADWRTMADLIAPESPATNRLRRAAEKLGAQLGDICRLARVRHTRHTVADLHQRLLGMLDQQMRANGVDLRGRARLLGKDGRTGQ